MSSVDLPSLVSITNLFAFGGLTLMAVFGIVVTPDMSNWKTCRDEQHGFSLRHPPDWHSTTPEGRCVQLQKGKSGLPVGVPEVDIFIQVTPLHGDFPADSLRDKSFPAQEGAGISPGVQYTDRQELLVNGLPAVRARFRSSGPTPNWGIEYAIRKDDQVLDIYISQPRPEIEADFEKMISTLRW